MKEIELTETIRVKRQPAVELTRLDLEIACRDLVEKRGYKVDSLCHFEYKDGALHRVVVEIVK